MQVLLGVFGAYYLIYASVKFMTSGKEKKQEEFEPEKQQFIDQYIKKYYEDQKIPKWVRGEREVFVAHHH
jgi:hypothetical protein